MQQDKQWKLVQIRNVVEVLLLFLFILLVQIVGYFLCTSICLLFRYKPEQSTFVMMISLVSALLAFLWCGYLYRKSSWREKPFPYREVFTGKNCFSWIAVGVGGCIFLKVLLTVLSQLLPGAFAEYQKLMGQFSRGDMTVSLLYVMLVGPVSEEMIFRGAMMDRFYLAFPFWLANILQAALFGVYHMNLIQGIYAFGLGLALGLIRKSSNTVLAAMIAHIAFNLTNDFLGILLPAGQKVSLMEMWVIFLVGVILFVKGLWYNKR